jgi:hypothetical protein
VCALVFRFKLSLRDLVEMMAERGLAMAQSAVATRITTPVQCPAADLAIMRRIDALHLDYPFAGSRMLRDLLLGEGIGIGRERITTMMRRMGVEAIYRRPHTSKPADGHKTFPGLLRGFVYLTAVVTGSAVGCWYGGCRPA